MYSLGRKLFVNYFASHDQLKTFKKCILNVGQTTKNLSAILLILSVVNLFLGLRYT